MPDDKIKKKKTGEVRPYNRPVTKSQCLESARVSLLHANELIKYNFLRYDKVYSVDLTFSKPLESYEEFHMCIKNYTRRLKRMYKEIKYVFVKEVGVSGRFHTHAIMWAPNLSESVIRSKWKYGEQVCVQVLKTNDDLIYKASYLTNITGFSESACKKRNNLIYFPAYKHLYLASKNLEKPKFKKGKPNVPVKRTIFETPEEKIIKFGASYHTFEAA